VVSRTLSIVPCFRKITGRLSRQNRGSAKELRKFEPIDFLDSDEALVEYLNVARAKGMTSVSEATGLGRRALYRSLSGDGNPRLDTLFKVLDMLDVRLAVTR